ncbi:MAG: GNAT family N-acetyltransferase [Candidatus Cohnella colombiensis]|uniref:GNAT family N-acetyltransferase n=1 Tax=Candidatus Cohnella colombiensis TaxID=3121368 RepID=A0AA95EWE1_9BACL|nr:MAG: GNAT family N-acetyltransferase [Cohnella sp.]
MPTNDSAKITPKLHLVNMTAEEAQSISRWTYPAPYDCYRWPEWGEMLREEREFADPHIREAQYQSVHDDSHTLVGYIQLFPLDRAIRIGLGLRPDCCNQGWGAALTRLAIDEALRRQPHAEIDLEVEEWNKRAIRTYEKAGFTITDQYTKRAMHGDVALFCMVYGISR